MFPIFSHGRMHCRGEEFTQDELGNLMRTMDDDGSKTIELNEFLKWFESRAVEQETCTLHVRAIGDVLQTEELLKEFFSR